MSEQSKAYAVMASSDGGKWTHLVCVYFDKKLALEHADKATKWLDKRIEDYYSTPCAHEDEYDEDIDCKCSLCTEGSGFIGSKDDPYPSPYDPNLWLDETHYYITETDIRDQLPKED